MKHIVIGNGPSLTPELLESLNGETWAVNRIWKIFDRTDWRPDNWVRGELPDYNEKDVIEDFKQMSKEACHIWIQKGLDGFRGYLSAANYTLYETCDGTQAHGWHLPLVCGYGTVVHIAAQLAVLHGADEITFVGCDLGTEHFYPGESFSNSDLARIAHTIVERHIKVSYQGVEHAN